jgi:phage terminase large subunit
LEEAYEIDSENDFNMLDESIRGTIPEGLFKQITITFNPWNEHHWLKKRFFDAKDTNVLAITTNYMCNEWLDTADLKVFEDMKTNNPRRYNVAGLGNWGVTDGLVYENFEESVFSVDEVSKLDGVYSVFGLDFGYVNDPTALFCGLIQPSNRTLYVFDEMYGKAMTNEDIAEKMRAMGYAKEKVTADCAEPKSIDRLRTLGIRNIRASRKGRDSIINGIDFIRGYKIIVHPKCNNFIKEINNYQWEKKKNTSDGAKNKPVDEYNHLMDAMRYALEDYIRGAAFSFE